MKKMAAKKVDTQNSTKKKKRKKYKSFVNRDMMLMFNGNIDPPADSEERMRTPPDEVDLRGY